jgi:Tfp pilus assembly protein PilV
MKKLLSMVLLLMGVVGLSACGLTASQDELLTSNQEIYAFSAISSTSLLAQGYESQPLPYQLGDTDETLI